MGAVRADAIRELWGLFHSSLDNADEVAGFQLAIWKILYEPTITENPNASMDITTGHFRVTDSGAFVGYANAYLASIVSDGQYRTDDLADNLYAISSDQFQDQIVQLPSPPILLQGPPPVPLPKTVWGGAVLMGAIGIAKRKKMARA